MSRTLSIFLILSILALGFAASPVRAQTTDAVPFPCPYLFPTELAPLLPPVVMADTINGSNYCVWAPPNWDKSNLVIFAHGYVDPVRPNGTIPADQLALTDPNTGATVDLPSIIMSMGYALAVPSYSKNGLAVKEGVQAVWDLGMAAKGMGVSHVYLVGASEGGLVTAWALEQHLAITSPAVVSPFTAGVSTCGPVGDFVQQINYWGDFRVAYDYYFVRTNSGPALLNDPISIDPQTIADWGFIDPTNPELAGDLQLKVLAAIQSHPTTALQLIASGKAPIDVLNPSVTIPATILGILDYNVKATDEARFEFSGDPNAYLDPIKGNPYGNAGRWLGTWFDFGLNKWVRDGNDRFKADPNVVPAIQNDYQTNGRLTVPLVTLHTTGDPIVPYWHEILYAARVWRTGNGLKLFSIPIPRYGHCAFTPKEAIFAFALAVFRATGQIPAMPTVTTSAGLPVLTQQEFNAMRNQYSPVEPKFFYLPTIRN